jgi:flagellar P-ring protein precursor FlgI
MQAKTVTMTARAALFAALVGALAAAASARAASRIKDIAHIDGVKREMVVGYGLVVGLSGTGDGRKATFTSQSLENMLERFGITVESEEFKVDNVAAVMATADIDPFMRPGARIDVTVSSLADASSLEGGTLLATPLLGLDGTVYAMAQGAVSIGGFNVSGGAGNSVRQNHTTAGRVVGGGVVQRAAQLDFLGEPVLELSARDMDFHTVTSMVSSINTAFGSGVATGVDGRTVRVLIPPEHRADPVPFIAELERLSVEVDVPARIVINEKTGTVVVGAHVEIGEAAIAHGSLTVEITTRYGVSQPLAPVWGNAAGQTVVVPEVQTQVTENEARVFAIRETITVGQLADALNGIGVTPRDLVAIFQALKHAGALRAELVVI